MKKFKHLNAKGFSHEIVLVLVVLVVAVGGTYYLVASHADSCSGASAPVSGTVSDPTSAPTCTPASGATSGPVSSPLTYLGSCKISSLASTVSSGTVLTPQVTVTNIGTGSIGPQLEYHYSSAASGATAHQYLTISNGIAPGASQTVTLTAFTPQSTTDVSYHLSVTGTNSSSKFTCTKAFKVTAVSNI